MDIYICQNSSLLFFLILILSMLSLLYVNFTSIQWEGGKYLNTLLEPISLLPSECFSEKLNFRPHSRASESESVF